MCESGALQVCPCIDGGEGVQECNKNRQGWGMCQCALSEDQNEDGGSETDGEMDHSEKTEMPDILYLQVHIVNRLLSYLTIPDYMWLILLLIQSMFSMPKQVLHLHEFMLDLTQCLWL